ncbi:MAG: glutathione S-transferase [Paraglaciecola psychrophila]|jgi:glutathione S-transferase
MSDIILHHYAGSPFSEKVRLLLGYKNLSYSSVDIPVIMPKPDFVALTGGYRKTPAMQIGADVYCDSAIMCRVIDSLTPQTTIYPAELEATLAASAHWIDTFFFKVCVAKLFQPKVMSTHPIFSDPAAAKAFAADRAALRQGSVTEPIDTAQAEAYWLMHVQQLELQLQHRPFLIGDTPTIVDFSTYHLLWFAYTNKILRDDFAPFTQVVAWYQRMTAFGHGQPTTISGSDALAVASAAEPQLIAQQEAVFIGELALGDRVDITPIDYGKQPTRGTLVQANMQELAVQRADSTLGNTVVHFPRLGFQVQAATD